MIFLPSSRIIASGALDFLRRNVCVANPNMKQLDADSEDDEFDINEDTGLEQSSLTVNARINKIVFNTSISLS
jgi:hypothetical protein